MERILQPLRLVLLLLAWAVAESHETVPYLRHFDTNLANNSYMTFSNLGPPDSVTDLRCYTDLTTCCNSMDGSDRGDWYYPNGTRLPFSSNTIFFLRRTQRVSLGRREMSTAGVAAEGIYRCSIETNAVRSDDINDLTTRELVYVGLYTGNGDSGSVVLQDQVGFEEFTGPNGETTHFAITCISTSGPPTVISWMRNSEPISDAETETILDDAVTAQYSHTLTVPGRTEGEYSCNVTNNKPSSDITMLIVAAPNPPQDLNVSQNGFNSVLVSWKPPDASSVSPTGYTITLLPLQGAEDSVTARVSVSETSTTVSGLRERATYSVTIVTNSITLSSNITGPENITIETVEVSISTAPLSPVMIGDTVTLSCLADLPEWVVGTPTFQWGGPGVLSLGSTLVVSSIQLEGAGQYTCTVAISFFNVSKSTDILIEIESPVPTIEESRSGNLYAGTSYSLSCVFDLESLPINSSEVEWTVDGNTVDISPNRISVLNESLVFSPLATSDGGSYACRLTLTGQEYVVILSNQQLSFSIGITVEDLPAPQVDTTSDSQLNIGDQLLLECSVSVVPHLVTQPTLHWTHEGPELTTQLVTRTGLSLTHTLSVSTISAAGRYICEASINIPEINLSVGGVQSVTQLTVQMPQPNIVINPDHTRTLYTGSTLTLSCVVTLNSSVVDTPTNVVIAWAGPRAIPGEWYTVSDTTPTSDFIFSSDLTISPLVDGHDNGDYICTASNELDYEYLLRAESSTSIALEITNPPPLMVTIATSGVLLTTQSYQFVCTANVVEDLLASLNLELTAPNGAQLQVLLGSNTLQYTIPSLETTHGGEYTCRASLVIPGSGIDSNITATKHITVVDAYPVQDIAIAFSNSFMLEVTWQPPQLGPNLTTAFTLTCTPLLAGIPLPLPVSTESGEELGLSLSELYAGVEYNCSVVTVTAQGHSEPVSIIQATQEIAPSGPPLSLVVVVGVSEVTFTWSLPEITLRNGLITGFTLSCHSEGYLVIRKTFDTAESHKVTGFSADTAYNCSVVATNSAGNSPPAVVALKTHPSPSVGGSKGLDPTPVVGGVVAVVLIVAVVVIVLVLVVVVARKKRQKYNLSRARPNSYIMRTADSHSATVTANPNTGEGDYSVIKANRATAAPEYEMIRTYSQLPPGKRPAPEYLHGSIHVTTNKHVAMTEIDGGGREVIKGGIVLNPQYAMLPGEMNGAAAVTESTTQQNPQYEKIEEYSRVGGASENVYEDPKAVHEVMAAGGVAPTGRAQYSVPQSRHNTVNQLRLVRPPEDTPTTYSVPRSRYNTVTQGTSPSSHNLYNTPRSRGNTATSGQPLPPLSHSQDPNRKVNTTTYDRLPTGGTDSNNTANFVPGQSEGENEGATLYQNTADASH